MIVLILNWIDFGLNLINEEMFWCLEKANAKADLSERVIFQKPVNLKRGIEKSGEEDLKKKKKKNISKQLLSFDQNEEDEC